MPPRLSSAAVPDGRAGFRAALRNRTFSRLFLAEAQSTVGDQLARVALSVLVFRATGSASATAATYAATLLPAVLGGIFLARLGDRHARRSVMIACDLFRAAAFGLMAVDGVPLPVVIALVIVAVTMGPAFSAAMVSTLAARLTPDLFRAANGLRQIVSQLTQVGGFLVGGLLVAFVGPRGSLLINAWSFLISAGLVASIGARAPRSATARAATAAPESRSASRTLAHDRPGTARVRGLVLLALLSGLFVVPEGLAVPFARSLGATTAETGVLFAAGAGGGAVGAVLVVLLRRRVNRQRLISWLAIGAGIPLIGTAFTHEWRLVAVLWFVSGMCTAYMVDATTLIVQAIPDRRRAASVGLLTSGLLACQGLSLIAFGGLATVSSLPAAVAVAGAVGVVIASCVAALTWRGNSTGQARRIIGRHHVIRAVPATTVR